MLNQNISNQTNEVQELSLVFINDREVMTDSLTVAQNFNKEHKIVLRDIRELIQELKAIGEGTIMYSRNMLESREESILSI